MKVFGFDTETYWDELVSVKTLGSYTYARHPLTRCYLMSGATNLGHTYAGSPDEFDFSAVAGPDWIWLSHNVGFDMQAYARLHEEDPKAFPWPQGHWYDTADLATYCGLPRALKGALFAAFGIVHDKTLRDKDTKGKQWHEFDPQLKTDFTKYALDDAVHMLRLWTEYSYRWPENERKISELSCLWAAEGLVTDKAYIEDRITYLHGVVNKAANDIPWVADGKPPLSKKELAIACRESGIPCPKSVAIDDEECEEWLDTYGDKYPWVMAARDWRRANAIQKKLQAIAVRTSDRFHYEIKYWGAGITGRWSGAGGVNVQNLSGKELYGVNMRKTIIAGPGKKLCAADLAQIEPRCGCWFAQEADALDAMARGVSPYIVYARQGMGLAQDETWAKSDPRYKVAKESVLGCGYSMGHHKFVVTIEGKVPQGRLTEDEVTAILDSPLEWESTEEKYFEYCDFIKRPQWLSFYHKQDSAGQHRLLKGWEIVMTFRNGRPKLVALWKSLGQAAKEAAARGEDLELGLPSGRTLLYKKCRFRRRAKTEEDPEGGHDIVADITRNGMFQTTKIHSGILIENLCISGRAEVLRFPGEWVRLDSITPSDIIWDGGVWVSHEGLLEKGEKPTVSVQGVGATGDHEFLTNTGWMPAEKAGQLPLLSISIPEYDKATTGREDNRGAHRALRSPDKKQSLAVAGEVLLRKHPNDSGKRPDTKKSPTPVLLEGLPALPRQYPESQNNPRVEQTSGTCRLELDAVPVQKPAAPGMEELRWAWYLSLPKMARFLRVLLGRYGANLPTGAGSGSEEQRPRLLEAKLPVGYTEPEHDQQTRRVGGKAAGAPGEFCGARSAGRSETLDTNLPADARGSARPALSETRLSEPVYDLLNCGPNHRFVVRGGPGMPPIIAHNCQSMARDAFRDCLLRVHEAGYKVLFHVHDELIVELDDRKAEEARLDIERIMGIHPVWAPTLPVAAEATLADSYDQAK